MAAAPGSAVEAAPGPTAEAVATSPEGAGEVDEDLGTQKIVEEDVCGFAALVMMPLDQTVLYTTHRPGPLAAEISAGPVIDALDQPCAPEDCPLGLFVHEEEELEAPTPNKFPVIATQPGSLMGCAKAWWVGWQWWRTPWTPRSPKYFDGML